MSRQCFVITDLFLTEKETAVKRKMFWTWPSVLGGSETESHAAQIFPGKKTHHKHRPSPTRSEKGAFVLRFGPWLFQTSSSRHKDKAHCLVD